MHLEACLQEIALGNRRLVVTSLGFLCNLQEYVNPIVPFYIILDMRSCNRSKPYDIMLLFECYCIVLYLGSLMKSNAINIDTSLDIMHLFLVYYIREY